MPLPLSVPVSVMLRATSRGDSDAWQMDLAVRRDFPIHERLKLQFRAEAFNIFNHPNFGAINLDFRSSLRLGRPRARLRVRWAS